MITNIWVIYQPRKSLMTEVFMYQRWSYTWLSEILRFAWAWYISVRGPWDAILCLRKYEVVLVEILSPSRLPQLAMSVVWRLFCFYGQEFMCLSSHENEVQIALFKVYLVGESSWEFFLLRLAHGPVTTYFLRRIKRPLFLIAVFLSLL